MLSTFGKELRKLRIEHELNLGDLGEMLKCSPAFISAIERGVKAVPPGFLSVLVDKLKLTSEEVRRLDSAAAMQMKDSLNIAVGKQTDRAKELAVAFARRFETLSEQEIDQMFSVLGSKK